MSNQQPKPGFDLAAAATALAQLQALDAAPVSGVVMATPDARSEATTFEQLLPTEEAGQELGSVIESSRRHYLESEVLPYSAAGLVGDGQVMAMQVSDVPLLAGLVEASADLARLPPFEPSKRNLSRARFVALRSDRGQQSALFLQWLKTSHVVAQSKRRGVILKRGTIEIPNGDVVILGASITAVVVDGYVFFESRPTFQRFVGLLEEVRARASATFKTITAGLRIVGYEEMAAAVLGTPAMLGKLASIEEKLRRYATYKGAMTMDNLLAFIHSHPEHEFDTSGSGDREALVFHNDAQRRFRILKLLDDNFLSSELTKLAYESSSQVVVPASGTSTSP